MTMLALLCVPACILGMGAVAAVLPTAVAGLNNAGPHGFSELLYAYTSGAATNGSAFAGLNANTPFYNLTLAAAMFAGRFIVIIPVLCIAGTLAAKRIVPVSVGTLPTYGMQFVGLLVGTVVIVGGLTFFPALALGPAAKIRDAGGYHVLICRSATPGAGARRFGWHDGRFPTMIGRPLNGHRVLRPCLPHIAPGHASKTASAVPRYCLWVARRLPDPAVCHRAGARRRGRRAVLPGRGVPALGAWVPLTLFPSRQDPQVAQVILSVIATSIMTVVSIVFAILLMTLTLASTQFSPRILINFVRDRGTQWTLGVFLGTFCLLHGRAAGGAFAACPVRAGADRYRRHAAGAGRVGWLIFFIHHISQAISVNHIVDRIARETELVIDELMPHPRGRVRADESGAGDERTLPRS